MAEPKRCEVAGVHLSRRAWVILACVLAGGLLFSYHYRIGIVSGESMVPSFKAGDCFLLSKRAYKTAEPRRGDVVVARVGGELIIKRIVGLPGEDIEFKTGRLYVNDRPCVERQELRAGALTIGRGRLGSGKFAVVGDNRAVPASQLLHPVVSREQLLGKVVWTMPTHYPR